MQAKPTWRKAISAFWRALQMTLRGQTYTPPPPAHPELRAWIESGQSLIKTVFQVADGQGFDESARKQRMLTLEGRPISVQTILAAVQHNFSREYGPLLDARLEHSLLTLVAFNMNDQYRVAQLEEALTDMPSVQASLKDLSAHLASMPRVQSKA